ncbi:hypothetical protein CHUAL_012365 [Chamberlinius hualienensis]
MSLKKNVTKNPKLHISIPGFNAAAHLNQSLFVRLVWTFMFISCAVICTIQLVDRIKHFFTYPVALTYEMADDEFNLFPRITFCRKLPYSMENICEKNDTEHINQYLNIWENSNQSFNSNFQVCRSNSGLSQCSGAVWTKQITSVGEAYTLDINAIFPNTSTWFLIFSAFPDYPTNWKLLLNDDDDVVYNCLTSSHKIEKKHSNLFVYAKTKLVYENVPPRPCLSERDYEKCINRCMDYILLSDNKCRLPFMKTLSHVPLCETIDEAKHVIRNLKSITEIENYRDVCKCERSCIKVEFLVDIDTRDLGNETRIVIISIRDEVEFLKEKRSYVHYAFICEVSGIIGLYLGACLLTFIEALQVVTLQAYKHMTKKSGKPVMRVNHS